MIGGNPKVRRRSSSPWPGQRSGNAENERRRVMLLLMVRHPGAYRPPPRNGCLRLLFRGLTEARECPALQPDDGYVRSAIGAELSRMLLTEPFTPSSRCGVQLRSPYLRRVLREISTVAPADSTVLICGKTGTGKELIARALHNHSPQKIACFREVQLRGDSYQSDRERALRTRERRFHGYDFSAHRSL